MRLLSNYLTITLIVLMLLNHVVNLSVLNIIIGSLTFIVICLVIYTSSRINQFFAVSMLLVSMCILIYQKAPMNFWFNAITNNLPLVSLIVLSPMLSIPVTLGKYDYYINNFILKYTKKANQLYFVISSLFFLLSPLLNLGSIHLIHSIINRLKLPKQFLGRVYIRAFFSASTWAPYFASVFLVIYYLKIPIKSYLGFGLILSIAQIIISYLLYTFWEDKNIDLKIPTANSDIRGVKVLEFIFVLIFIVCSIFLLEGIFETNIVVLITSIILIYTFIWTVYLRKITEFASHLKQFFRSIIPRSSNEIVLFLSAGFFAIVISHTHFGDFINVYWLRIGEVSIYLLIILTIIVISTISFTGIHHIVTISIILTTVDYNILGISDLTMAMILLSSYAMGAIVSPVSPANVIVANIINGSVYKVIIKYNLIYTIVTIIIHSIIIYLFYLLL